MGRAFLVVLLACACGPSVETDRRAFLLAAESGNTRVVREELAKGIGPDEVFNRHDRTALCLAAMSGRVENVRILLEAGADPDWGDEGTNIRTEVRALRKMLEKMRTDPELTGTYRLMDGTVIDLRTMVTREREYDQVIELLDAALAKRTGR